MISLETITNPDQNKQIVSLVYYSMRNKYTSVSNPDGLTFSEVRTIISDQKVSVIKFNDRIIGIVRTEIADRRLKLSLDIDINESYFHIGMIYIAKNERGKGYASKTLLHFLKEHKNILYIAHQSNISSNKVGGKYLNFFKEYSSFGSFEPYNVYKIEQ